MWDMGVGVGGRGEDGEEEKRWRGEEEEVMTD
jgi:hypothetical protein